MPSETSLTPSDEDARWDLDILEEVFIHHPYHLREDELLQALGAGADAEFGVVDGARRAIRDLTRNGVLLRREGNVIAPTLAAVTLAEIFQVPS